MKKIRSSRRLLAAALLLGGGLGMFFPVRARLRPAAMELARTQVTNATSATINSAVADELERGTIRYDRIITCEKDRNGRICALKTNLSEVNRLKTGILGRINREILTQDTRSLSIRLGSLLLPAFFGGKGPRIPVQIQSIRRSDAAFRSRFTEAGINQTCQQLTMDIRVDVTVLVLGKTESFPVTTQIVVAETVLVGDVPDTFIQTGGNHGSERRDQTSDRAAEHGESSVLRSG